MHLPLPQNQFLREALFSPSDVALPFLVALLRIPPQVKVSLDSLLQGVVRGELALVPENPHRGPIADPAVL